MNEPLAILRVGACCPVGLDVVETAASLRAGISRKTESGLLDQRREPIVVGHVEDAYLPALAPALQASSVGSLQRRILRLAGAALAEALAEFPGSAAPTLFVAGPQPGSSRRELVDALLPTQLAVQARVSLDLAASRVLPLGHAGLFAAIAAAREQLLGGQREFVLVGGVDSYFDARRLAELEREQRLQSAGPQDAFTPGEGAAFMLLTRRATCQRLRLEPLAWVLAHGLGSEPGHRYSEQPHLGDGLAAAFAASFAALTSPLEPITLLLAGLNGERLQAREGGIALLRHRKRFAEQLRIEHAAAYTGDAGAALAPLMLATTAHRMHARTEFGPALLWACSDHEQRGALILHTKA